VSRPSVVRHPSINLNELNAIRLVTHELRATQFRVRLFHRFCLNDKLVAYQHFEFSHFGSFPFVSKIPSFSPIRNNRGNIFLPQFFRPGHDRKQK
jgi:hypothetical protein